VWQHESQARALPAGISIIDQEVNVLEVSVDGIHSTPNTGKDFGPADLVDEGDRSNG